MNVGPILAQAADRGRGAIARRSDVYIIRLCVNVTADVLMRGPQFRAIGGVELLRALGGRLPTAAAAHVGAIGLRLAADRRCERFQQKLKNLGLDGGLDRLQHAFDQVGEALAFKRGPDRARDLPIAKSA